MAQERGGGETFFMMYLKVFMEVQLAGEARLAVVRDSLLGPK